MSDDTNKSHEPDAGHDSAAEESASEQQSSAQNGPQFTKAPDPLAGVKRGASDVLDSMEGKTVSMKVYVGTIIGIILLMLLARCGG